MTVHPQDALLYAAPAEVARLRDDLVARQVDLLAAYSPFYRRLLGDAGIGAGDVRGLADLARVPLTSKTDFLADPDAYNSHLLEALNVR